MQGIIVKGVGGSYQVRCAEQDYTCHAKGVLRYLKHKPLVGDRVSIEILDEEKHIANLIEILPRRNELIRPAVANIDQAMIEFAVKDPEPNFNLLDRFLLFMEKQAIPVTIIVNKVDLDDQNRLDTFRSIYEPIGYTVLPVSTQTGEGVEAIREAIRGKVTVWAGPSGVGKSSLINRLAPEEQMETGELSQKIMRGKNTTRHTQLLCCGENTFVCDTPGFSSIDVFETEPEKVKDHFREFAKATSPCRFSNCLHLEEPSCGVKAAVEAGLISPERYENYRLFYKECKSKKPF